MDSANLMDPAPDAITQAVVTTMNDAAFMDLVVTDAPQAPLPAAQYAIWARMAVTAPVRGEFICLGPLTLIAEATATIHARQFDVPTPASPDDPTVLMLRDTMAELLNTIGGLIMETLTPGDASFQLGLPETGLGLPPAAAGGAETVMFERDGSLFVVYYDLHTAGQGD